MPVTTGKENHRTGREIAVKRPARGYFTGWITGVVTAFRNTILSDLNHSLLPPKAVR